MANTRDTLGDQETLDGLIDRSLINLEENGVTSLRDYAFYQNSNIKKVNLPSLTSMGIYSFQDCKLLEEADLPLVTNINNYGFSTCNSLEKLDINNLNILKQYALQNCYSMNDIDTSEVTGVSSYTFSNSGIGELILPVCTSLGTYTGQGQRMSTIDLTKNISISSNKFNGANGLVHLILRSSTLCSLSATNALTGTPLANKIGWIYVPTDLIDTYKSATNWSTYADQIVDINEYPKALQNETITDSWSDIFTNENNGTYSTRYSVGDIKCVNIGGTHYPMQIIAKDKDVLASGGTAKITWCGLGLLCQVPMNFTAITTDGWVGSWMRKFLRETIYPQIDSTVRSNIKEVTKTYEYRTNGTQTLSTTDTVFIPSAREIFGGTSYESSGIDYTDVFNSSNARIKYNGLSTSASFWWLRSAYSATYFRCVGSSGAVTNFDANIAIGVALCFCT